MTIPQNYTIFSNTNRLVLTNYPNIPFFDGDLQDVVNKFEKGNIEETLINVADLEQGLSQVKACYAEVIFAAGGLVKTPEGKLLCINRLGRWDLPKGKVEAGETMDIAALRVFAAVVDAGSFVGAAEALGLSRAAVSRLVGELESLGISERATPAGGARQGAGRPSAGVAIAADGPQLPAV